MQQQLTSKRCVNEVAAMQPAPTSTLHSKDTSILMEMLVPSPANKQQKEAEEAAYNSS
jgi:hypothetical protein